MVFQRTACVDRLTITSVSLSSICQIGDSQLICSSSRALAVQREKELFYGNEGNYEAYPIFSEELLHAPITEKMTMSSLNLNPLIKVKNINITAVSSCSVAHLGNSGQISMESRVKHIRQLEQDEEQSEQEDHIV